MADIGERELSIDRTPIANVVCWPRSVDSLRRGDTWRYVWSLGQTGLVADTVDPMRLGPPPARGISGTTRSRARRSAPAPWSSLC